MLLNTLRPHSSTGGGEISAVEEWVAGYAKNFSYVIRNVVAMPK